MKTDDELNAELARRFQTGINTLAGDAYISAWLDLDQACLPISDPAVRLPGMWPAFYSSMAALDISSRRFGLQELAGRCESPIEEAMLLALLLTGKALMLGGVEIPVWSRAGEPCCHTEPRRHELEVAIVCPQHKMGSYRADFLLTVFGEVKLEDGKYKYLRAPMIVEVDGHDFHERTKEQASSDKARDRDLQALGYPVYRYTGSDVWRDPIGCASQVYKAAFGAVDRLKAGQ